MVSNGNICFVSNFHFYDGIHVFLFQSVGDTNTGKWHENEFRRTLENDLDLEDLSHNETITIAGNNCYEGVRKLFNESGYDKILVGLGDHEIGEISHSGECVE